MAEITASLVKELRDKTGAGMMDCKRALGDTGGDVEAAVDWLRKDLSICLGEARKNGANLPVAALVDQFYSEVQKMGGKRWDTSSLLARLQR